MVCESLFYLHCLSFNRIHPSQNITTAFVDISTYDDLEAMMYGGKARNLFRRTIVKSAWFSVISAQMNSQGGTVVDFGSEYQAVFSRTADYILNCMLKHTHARMSDRFSAFS